MFVSRMGALLAVVVLTWNSGAPTPAAYAQAPQTAARFDSLRQAWELAPSGSREETEAARRVLDYVRRTLGSEALTAYRRYLEAPVASPEESTSIARAVEAGQQRTRHSFRAERVTEMLDTYYFVSLWNAEPEVENASPEQVTIQTATQVQLSAGARPAQAVEIHAAGGTARFDTLVQRWNTAPPSSQAEREAAEALRALVREKVGDRVINAYREYLEAPPGSVSETEALADARAAVPRRVSWARAEQMLARYFSSGLANNADPEPVRPAAVLRRPQAQRGASSTDAITVPRRAGLFARALLAQSQPAPSTGSLAARVSLRLKVSDTATAGRTMSLRGRIVNEGGDKVLVVRSA